MSFEPFRGSTPSRPPPQSYEEFRATGKSIELNDVNDRNRNVPGAAAGPTQGYIPGGYPPPPPPPIDSRPVIVAPYYPTGDSGSRFAGKSFWSRIRLFLRFISLLFSFGTGLGVGLVLKKYNETRNQRNTEELFWPKNPKLQPTIYMIVAAVVTFVVHIGLIISHFVGRRKGAYVYHSTAAVTKTDRISVWIQFLLCMIWIVGGFLARLYSTDKYGDGNDLWSWTCTEAWHERTVRIDFASLCSALTWAYHMAYANAFLEFLSLLTYSLNSCWARSNSYQTRYH